MSSSASPRARGGGRACGGALDRRRAPPPAVQGALDGGLDIPHNDKRFVGYDADAKEFDSETMKKYIFGGHVAEYMEGMEEEEPEKFREHFKAYLDNEVEADADEIEEMYTKVRRAARVWQSAAAVFVGTSKPAEHGARPWQAACATRQRCGPRNGVTDGGST